LKNIYTCHNIYIIIGKICPNMLDLSNMFKPSFHSLSRFIAPVGKSDSTFICVY
ncbi:hypothetical protein ACJX0J_034008, partial [Zea mays]